MTATFFDTYLRPVIARVLAIALIWASTWTAKQFGAPISPELQTQITELAIALLAYALVHRAVSTVTNPSDAAKTPPPGAG